MKIYVIIVINNKSFKNRGDKNKIKVYDSLIPISTAIAGARAAEKSVIDYGPGLPVSQAYRALAEEILPEIENRLGRRVEVPEITPSTTVVFDEVFMAD